MGSAALSDLVASVSSADLLISLGALIVAVVALVLGRLDRRRDRIERQARSVSVAVEEAHRQTSEHSYALQEWKLDVHNHSDLPIKNYDQKTVQQIEGRLDDLSPEELEEIEEYEREHRSRKTLSEAIDRAQGG